MGQYPRDRSPSTPDLPGPAELDDLLILTRAHQLEEEIRELRVFLASDPKLADDVRLHAQLHGYVGELAQLRTCAKSLRVEDLYTYLGEPEMQDVGLGHYQCATWTCEDRTLELRHEPALRHVKLRLEGKILPLRTLGLHETTASGLAVWLETGDLDAADLGWGGAL